MRCHPEQGFASRIAKRIAVEGSLSPRRSRGSEEIVGSTEKRLADRACRHKYPPIAAATDTSR
jgi:hypothetical protein